MRPTVFLTKCDNSIDRTFLRDWTEKFLWTGRLSGAIGAGRKYISELKEP